MSEVTDRGPRTTAEADTGVEPDGRRSWVVAVAGAFAMVFTFGTLHSYGVFFGPFASAYDVSRVALSTVFSVELFVFYAGAGVVGLLATRASSRLVMLGCGALAALVAPAPYLIDSYAGLLVVFALLGLSLGTAFVVLASVVPRWFEERRGAATGLIFAGNGLGLLVLPPAWQVAFQDLGVRRGFLVLVGITAVVFLLAGAVCPRPPWVEGAATSLPDVTAWLGELVRTRSFRLLFVGMGLAFGWYNLLAAYAVDMFAARGLTATGAATAFGLIGGVSIVSRLAGGAVADAAGYRRTFLASLGCATVGCAVLLVPQLPAIAVAVFLLGIGFGGIATLYVPVLMGIYDPEKDTAVVGVFNVSFGLFALVAPPAATAATARLGTYDGAVLLTLLTTVGALATVAAGTRT